MDELKQLGERLRVAGNTDDADVIDRAIAVYVSLQEQAQTASGAASMSMERYRDF